MAKVSLTYISLRLSVRSAAKKARALADRQAKLTARLQEESDDVKRIAEQIASLKVDPFTVAETEDVGGLMRQLWKYAAWYAAAALETSKNAFAADRQAQESHGGIKEAADRSPVEMADRGWYKQE
ncbi:MULTISPECIES: hypothetical protein [Streptomycetaceae]|uniref:hypothetical protein n=1 Tax=Streptomycetaceae TaxID=2062 RepID=UPI00093C26F5|nr:hypothetical protein [Streptomyces sp. CB02056]OKH97523.1 hypothetical protein AMK13_38065 [Streptomyces sp. CB02056]